MTRFILSDKFCVKYSKPLHFRCMNLDSLPVLTLNVRITFSLCSICTDKGRTIDHEAEAHKTKHKKTVSQTR